jgi:hypothetical protein
MIAGVIIATMWQATDKGFSLATQVPVLGSGAGFHPHFHAMLNVFDACGNATGYVLLTLEPAEGGRFELYMSRKLFTRNYRQPIF